MNRARSFRRRAISGGSITGSSSESSEHSQIDRIEIPSKQDLMLNSSLEDMPIKCSTTTSVDKKSFQEDKAAGESCKQYNIMCSTIDEDDLHMPDITSPSPVYQDDASCASAAYSSSSSSDASDVAPITDLVAFDETDSTVITVESRSVELYAQSRSSSSNNHSNSSITCCSIASTTKTTIVEEKPVPPSCVKFEKSSMAIFDQLVQQRSCLNTIVKSIKSFPGTDAAMQEWVCDALARWSFDDLNRRLIVENGGFEIIKSAMKRHPTVASVQIQGCRAFGNLCYDSPRHSVLLRKEGGVSVIIDAMATCHVVHDVFSKACYALTTLLANDVNSADHMNSHNLVDIVVEGMLINCQNVTAQRLGCAVLWHLLPSYTPRKRQYSTAEIINIILNYSLLCHLDDANAQKYAIALLTKCVTVDPDDKSSLGEIYEMSNWIILSIKVHPEEPYIMDDGCSLLLNLMNNFGNTKVLEMITTMKLESVLVESIWSHRDSPHVVERILAVLAKLAGQSHEYALCITSAKAIPAIVSVMMANITNVHLQYQACLCLSNLSQHKDLQESIGSAGGVYAIVDAMRFYPQNLNLQVRALSALERMAQVPYNAVMVSLSDGVPIVEKAGNAYPEQCKKNANKVVALTHKANQSSVGNNSKRRQGGPFLYMKYCHSVLGISLQKQKDHQRGRVGGNEGRKKKHLLVSDSSISNRSALEHSREEFISEGAEKLGDLSIRKIMETVQKDSPTKNDIPSSYQQDTNLQQHFLCV